MASLCAVCLPLLVTYRTGTEERQLRIPIVIVKQELLSDVDLPTSYEHQLRLVVVLDDTDFKLETKQQIKNRSDVSD